MIHYELIILYGLGLKPKDVIKSYGYSRSSAYRFYRIYRLAGEKARNLITDRNSVSPARERKTNNLDARSSKKFVPQGRKKKVDWRIEKDVTIARVRHDRESSETS